MGVVWRARHLGLNRMVALKLVKSDAEPDPAVFQRFQREAEATVKAAHPGVVKVLDTGRTADGQPFFAMELVEGRTLAQVAADGPMDEALARRLLGDAAEALASVHAGGFVHRDVKPANFMLERGPDGRLLLMDFGVVRSGDANRLTATGEYLGTPVYMAPEQVVGQPATPASDVFALGVTFWQMVAGRLPYPEDSLVKVLSRIASQGAPSLGTVGAGHEMVDLVDSMIRKDPASRPTANQVALRAKAQPPRRSLASSRTTVHVAQAPTPRLAVVAAPRTARPRWPAVLVVAAALGSIAMVLRRPGSPGADFVEVGRGAPPSAPSAPEVRDLHGMVADTALMLSGAVVPPGPVAVDVRGPDGQVLSWRQDAARPRFRAVVRGLKPETDYQVKVSGQAWWTVTTASGKALASARNMMAGTGDLQLMATLIEKPSPLALAGHAVEQALQSGDFLMADALATGLKGLTPDTKLVDRGAALARAAASGPLVDALLASARELSPLARSLLAQAADRAGHPRALELARAAIATPRVPEAEEVLLALMRNMPRDGDSVTEAAHAVETCPAAGPHAPWLDAFLELPAAPVRAVLARWRSGTDVRLGAIAVVARGRQGELDDTLAKAHVAPGAISAAAACALADRGDADAVARLTALIDVPRAQLAAAIALARCAPVPAPEALAVKLAGLAGLGADEPTRRAAVLALGELRAASSRPALLVALNDSAADVRRAALLALARLRTREGVKGLEEDIAKAGTAPYAAALLGATANPDDAKLVKRLASEVLLASANPVHPRPARAAAYAWALARQAPEMWRQVLPQLDPDDGIVREAGRCGLDPAGTLLLPLDIVHRTGVRVRAGESIAVRLAGELGPNDAPKELVKIGGAIPAPYRPVAILGTERAVLGRQAVRMVARAEAELVISLLDWPLTVTQGDLKKAPAGALLLGVVRGGHLAVW